MTQVANAPNDVQENRRLSFIPKRPTVVEELYSHEGWRRDVKCALKCRRGPWMNLLVPMSTRSFGPLYRVCWRRSHLGWERGESWFGPDAVLRWVCPLVHFAVRVWRFRPQRVTRFRLFLVCGSTTDDPIFSQLSFGESLHTRALGFRPQLRCAFCSYHDSDEVIQPFSSYISIRQHLPSP